MIPVRDRVSHMPKFMCKNIRNQIRLQTFAFVGVSPHHGFSLWVRTCAFSDRSWLAFHETKVAKDRLEPVAEQ